jgi:hypothetical protein
MSAFKVATCPLRVRWLAEDRARYTHREIDPMMIDGAGDGVDGSETTVVYEFLVHWVGGAPLVDWSPVVVSVNGREPTREESLRWRIVWADGLAVHVHLLIEESQRKQETETEDNDGDANL